ncbi:MAG: hypothetical protein K0Q55_829 [Verrucomicrobia bacterium]|jgi:hypothetical protein|nr:hypothetical protein [Verrucomicrobiota bacterium]
MKTIILTFALTAFLSFSTAYASHSVNCKNVHGKITAVTSTTVTIGEKSFKLGKNTRAYQDSTKIKTSDLKVGNFVCINDDSKKNAADGEIASVTVLTDAIVTIPQDK